MEIFTKMQIQKMRKNRIRTIYDLLMTIHTHNHSQYLATFIESKLYTSMSYNEYYRLDNYELLWPHILKYINSPSDEARRGIKLLQMTTIENAKKMIFVIERHLLDIGGDPKKADAYENILYRHLSLTQYHECRVDPKVAIQTLEYLRSDFTDNVNCPPSSANENIIPAVAVNAIAGPNDAPNPPVAN
jgi:hypothetical protein